MECKGCEVVYINGVKCHELGCPEAWKDETITCTECGCEFKRTFRTQKVCSTCYETYGMNL